MHPEEHIEVLPGIVAETLQTGKIIRCYNLRPFGDNPALTDDRFVYIVHQLFICGFGHQIIVHIGYAEGGQMLPGMPQYFSVPGGIFNSVVINIHDYT